MNNISPNESTEDNINDEASHIIREVYTQQNKSPGPWERFLERNPGMLKDGIVNIDSTELKSLILQTLKSENNIEWYACELNIYLANDDLISLNDSNDYKQSN